MSVVHTILCSERTDLIGHELHTGEVVRIVAQGMKNVSQLCVMLVDFGLEVLYVVRLNSSDCRCEFIVPFLGVLWRLLMVPFVTP